MNFLRLHALVFNEDTAVTFLRDRGILHRDRFCAVHNPPQRMSLSLEARDKRWRCRVGDCREHPKSVGIRQGTWLEGGRLPLDKLIYFIYWWSKEKTSISFCQHELEIETEAIVDYNNYLREVCAAKILNNPVQIGGVGTVVEIDETLYSKRKNNMGRVLPEQWVFGGICRQSRQSFLVAVPDRTAATLIPIIQNYILPGTHIMSDEWRPYVVGIPQLLDPTTGLPLYDFSTVNHSQTFVNPVDLTNTQMIESTWCRVKARNKRQCGTARQMVDGYLCEYMWRSHLNGLDAFDCILQDIVQFMPPVA